IATASAAKRAFVQNLGADEVIDYNAVDFSEAVHDVDVVLELVGRGNAQRSLRVLREGGLLVTAVERTNAELAQQTEAAGRRFAGVAVEPDYVALERLTELVEAGKIRPHVDETLPLAEAAKAHQLVEKGSTAGKIVLTV
ncbi:MAG: zinc-binding dehydrogenase, partial [Methylobacteriaceae bacterium]|nr:zinc-binding dehydrogenase [Methylobacteriaceae bacterium]